MQTTHFRSVSVLLVARDAPNADMSLILFPKRLESHYVSNGQNKIKTTMQTTHLSVVSAVLVAKAAPNADMSLILLFSRLQGRYVNNW